VDFWPLRCRERNARGGLTPWARSWARACRMAYAVSLARAVLPIGSGAAGRASPFSPFDNSPRDGSRMSLSDLKAAASCRYSCS